MKKCLAASSGGSRRGRLLVMAWGLTLFASLGVMVVVVSGASAAGGGGQAVVCPNEQLREEDRSEDLPDCRAYEKVTPTYQEGYEFFAPVVAASGESLVAQSLALVPGTSGDNEGSAHGSGYYVTHTGGGWTLSSWNPAVSEFPGQLLLGSEPESALSLWALHTPEQSAFTHDLNVRESDGTFTEIGPELPPEVSKGPPTNVTRGSFEIAASTATYSAVLFELNHLYEGVRTVWSDDATVEGESLLEYTGLNNDAPELVGVTGGRGSTHLLSTCGTLLGSGGGGGSKYNALSANGETVFFTPEAGECTGDTATGEPASGKGPKVREVYARLDKQVTVDLSEPPLATPGRACSGICSEDENEENGHQRSKAVFEGASEAGTSALIMTGQPLVNSASTEGLNLYDVTLNQNEVTGIEDVSADSIPGEAAGVEGVMRIADNGSRVYFVARGVLATNAGAATDPGTGVPEYAVAGENNLYDYDAATKTVAFIGRLSEEDSEDWSHNDERTVQATPDGEYLLFASHEDLTSDDHSSSGAPQLFEYEAANNTLARVTVGEEGYNNDGNVEQFASEGEREAYVSTLLGSFSEGTPRLRTTQHARNLSNDGTVVTFESPYRLSSRALAADADCASVYEYRSSPGDIQNGTVHLISDGHDVNPNEEAECGARYAGMDASGANIFFETADSILSSDTNTQRDLYDARVDGGTIEATAPVVCRGEECHPPTQEVTAAQTMLPSSQPAEGNLLAPAPVASQIKKASTPLQRALSRCKLYRKSKRRGRCEAEAHRAAKHRTQKRTAKAKRRSSGKRGK